jgi:HSP20 family protein
MVLSPLGLKELSLDRKGGSQEMTLFNSPFDLARDGLLFANNRTARAFLPPTDVIVSDAEVVVAMDVPGLNADTLEIELLGDVLTIRGERQYPKFDQQSTQWYRLERGYGKFQRTLQIPKGLDPDTVSASIADGVLTIHVPLPEARKPRRIQIAGGNQHTIDTNTNWEELEAAATTDNSGVEEPALAGSAA